MASAPRYAEPGPRKTLTCSSCCRFSPVCTCPFEVKDVTGKSFKTFRTVVCLITGNAAKCGLDARRYIIEWGNTRMKLGIIDQDVTTTQPIVEFNKVVGALQRVSS